MSTDRPDLADGILRAYLSDNAVGASPEILAAVVAASAGVAAPYGEDPLSIGVTDLLSATFEHTVDVFPVATGSAANGIALAALTPPWGAVLCHPDAHIANDEAGAPEFFTNGAKLVPVGGANGKIDPDLLREAASRRRGDIHSVQPAVLSITQATESGSVYSIDELRTLTAIARDAGLRVHMDGARFANALVALGASPAEMTWMLGVDVLSFGATKNGAMTADAVVSFDPALAAELAFRHKRAGQLTSKMRFQTAQLAAYLADGLWLRNAVQANEMARRLRDGFAVTPGVEVLGDDLISHDAIGEATANILFCRFSEHLTSSLRDRGFDFYAGRWEQDVVRIVTSFAHTERDIDALLTAAREVLRPQVVGV